MKILSNEELGRRIDKKIAEELKEKIIIIDNKSKERQGMSCLAVDTSYWIKKYLEKN